MSSSPLAAPTHDSPLLAHYCRHFQIELSRDPWVDLEAIATAFARLPYENLTKIIAHHHRGETAFRAPDIVLKEHVDWGAGGTCFSLTATILHLVRAIGIPAEPILADRPYGTDTHSAILVSIDGTNHLLDPGYLLTKPIPVNSDQTIATSFNDVLLSSRPRNQLALSTRSLGREGFRLSYKLSPVDEVEFIRAWKASFDWDMMHYPLISRATDSGQQYLQSSRYQIRSREHLSHVRLESQTMAKRIVQEFGIHESIVREALAILSEQGDLSGRHAIDQPRPRPTNAS